MSFTRPRSHEDEVAQDAERRPEVILGVTERQAAIMAMLSIACLLAGFFAGMLR